MRQIVGNIIHASHHSQNLSIPPKIQNIPSHHEGRHCFYRSASPGCCGAGACCFAQRSQSPSLRGHGRPLGLAHPLHADERCRPEVLPRRNHCLLLPEF